jgi:hypothetical protein
MSWALDSQNSAFALPVILGKLWSIIFNGKTKRKDTTTFFASLSRIRTFTRQSRTMIKHLSRFPFSCVYLTTVRISDGSNSPRFSEWSINIRSVSLALSGFIAGLVVLLLLLLLLLLFCVKKATIWHYLKDSVSSIRCLFRRFPGLPHIWNPAHFE